MDTCYADRTCQSCQVRRYLVKANITPVYSPNTLGDLASTKYLSISPITAHDVSHLLSEWENGGSQGAREKGAVGRVQMGQLLCFIS